jgi:hypothetical protein
LNNIKAYQIYYDESQKDSLSHGFIPHFNAKATVHLESGIICDLVNRGECSNCDYFGVFSWNLKNKIKTINFCTWGDKVNEYNGFDLLTINTFNYNKHKHFPPLEKHYPRKLHGTIWSAFDLLLKKLYEQNILPNRQYLVECKKYIYCNYFIAKKNIYLDYVNSLLNPAIDLSQTDDELNSMIMQLDLEYNLPPKRFVEDTGFTTYPKIPFILERLINVYIEAHKLKVGWVL